MGHLSLPNIAPNILCGGRRAPLELQPVQKIRGTLRMTGGREDSPVVGLTTLTNVHRTTEMHGLTGRSAS
jgi:hypothetical protein